MEDHVILSASSKEELNKLIDEKLKSRYLLKDAMYMEDGKFNQLMILPNNIDSEMTLSSGVKLIIGATIYASILYFFL